VVEPAVDVAPMGHFVHVVLPAAPKELAAHLGTLVYSVLPLSVLVALPGLQMWQYVPL